MPRASWRGYLRLSLVSCPIYLSPATARTKPIRLHQLWRGTRGDALGDLPDRDDGRDILDRRRGLFLRRSRISRHRFAPQLGLHSGLTIRAQAKKSRKKRSSGGTNTNAASTSRLRRTS
jgi:hypothetical protein